MMRPVFSLTPVRHLCSVCQADRRTGFSGSGACGYLQAQHGVLANAAHVRKTSVPVPVDPHWLMRGGLRAEMLRNGRGSKYTGRLRPRA